MEFIVTGYIIHANGQHGNTGEDIVQPGGVVADEEIRTLLLAEILFEGVVDVVLLVHEKPPYRAQNVVNSVGLGNLSGVDLLFYGGFCHTYLPFFHKWAPQGVL
jgi:hypothetical protein